MFDIASSEFLLVMLVALLVIGPKDLPKVLRVVGQWVGKARNVVAQFRGHFDEMIRQSELEEMEKKWQAENERIMRESRVDLRADMIGGEARPAQPDAVPDATEPAEVPAKS